MSPFPFIMRVILSAAMIEAVSVLSDEIRLVSLNQHRLTQFQLAVAFSISFPKSAFRIFTVPQAIFLVYASNETKASRVSDLRSDYNQ